MNASERPLVAAAIFLSAFVVCERRASACDCVRLPTSEGRQCRGFDFVVGRKYVVFAIGRDSETGLPGMYDVSWCAGTESPEADAGKQRLRETLQLAR
jgi:hypothetical protein